MPLILNQVLSTASCCRHTNYGHKSNENNAEKSHGRGSTKQEESFIFTAISREKKVQC